jgi:hypothetical protein
VTTFCEFRDVGDITFLVATTARRSDIFPRQ